MRVRILDTGTSQSKSITDSPLVVEISANNKTGFHETHEAGQQYSQEIGIGGRCANADRDRVIVISSIMIPSIDVTV
jgi:hypothetical protein